MGALANKTAGVVDDVLDATVVLSFTSVGPAVRSRVQHWAPLPSMAGRRVVVTGANSGIGFAAARRCAELGATVHLAVRDLARGEDARRRIVQAHPAASVEVARLDAGDLASVRAFAEGFRAAHDSLDVLVHNAGALLHERHETADGIETTLATHVVGPFLLTTLLLPVLERSGAGRVITVTSGGMYTTGWSMRMLDDDPAAYDGARAYAQAKRAQMLLTEEWTARTAGRAVTFHAMHPGWADTPGVATSLPRFRTFTRPLLRTPAQGADTIVWLAAEPTAADPPGSLWLDRRRRATHKLRRTRAGDRHRVALFDAIAARAGAGDHVPGAVGPAT